MGGYGRNSFMHMRGHELFIPTKFHKHSLSGILHINLGSRKIIVVRPEQASQAHNHYMHYTMPLHIYHGHAVFQSVQCLSCCGNWVYTFKYKCGLVSLPVSQQQIFILPVFSVTMKIRKILTSILPSNRSRGVWASGSGGCSKYRPVLYEKRIFHSQNGTILIKYRARNLRF